MAPIKLEAINKQLRALTQGPILEWTDRSSNPLHDFQSDCLAPFPSEELERYLLRDLVDIVHSFLDWDELKGLALFSLPLKELGPVQLSKEFRILLPRNVIFFGRTDSKPFQMRLIQQHDFQEMPSS